MLVSQVFVGDVVFRADEQTTWSIVAPGDGDKEVGMFVQRFGIFSDDVVQAKIEFVEGEILLGLDGCFASSIAIEFLHERGRFRI